MRHCDAPLTTVLHTTTGKRTLCGAPNVKRTDDRPLPLCAECQHILKRTQPNRAPRPDAPVRTFLPSVTPHNRVMAHTLYIGTTPPPERYRKQA